MTHFYFIDTSMSDSILSDCPFAAICHVQQNVTAYRWEGSIHTAISPISTSDVMGKYKIRNITFKIALILSFPCF